jgi:hypothetical protein
VGHHCEGEADAQFSQVPSLEDHVVTPDPGVGGSEGTISQAIMFAAWNMLPLLVVAVVSKKTVTRECTGGPCLFPTALSFPG